MAETDEQVEEEEQQEEQKQYASIEDCTAPTDEDGKVIPVEKEIEGIGLCKFKPLVWKEGQSFFEDRDQNKQTLGAEEIASLFRNFYVHPDFSGVRGKTLRNEFYYLSVANLLTELMRHSGADVQVNVNQQDMSATIEKGKKK